jgi:hypothetical protein
MMFYWDSLCITRAKKNTHLLGKTLAEAAEDRKREQVLNSLFWSISPPVDPFDVAADLYIEEKQDLYVSGDWMSEDDMKHVMKEKLRPGRKGNKPGRCSQEDVLPSCLIPRTEGSRIAIGRVQGRRCDL